MARGISETPGFDDYKAEDKADYIKMLKQSGRKVVMVGDGINDALALSKADVGIAMGTGGNEAAIEAADISLADSRMERLAYQRQLSRQTLKIINQNYYLALGTNIAGVVFSVAGMMTPVMAGAVHIFHSAGIMINSGRLIEWKGKRDT